MASLLTLKKEAEQNYLSQSWPKTSEEEWRRSDVSLLDLESYNNKNTQFQVRDNNFLQPIESAMELLNKSQKDNRFITWNDGFYSANAFIHIPKNTEVTEPIFIELEENGDAEVIHSKVIINAESNTKASVIIKYSGQGDLIINHHLFGEIQDNAQLTVILLQNSDEEGIFIGHNQVAVHNYGKLHFFTSHLGSNFVKDRIQADLQQSGAEAELRGLYFVHQDDHLDLRSVQNHFAPHCTSHSVYKGAAKDEAFGIFQGMIHVDESASKTDAYLTNKNIVLNNGARCDSIPSLNIETNDVRCSHGSTTGKIDPEQLFYLQARGYSPEEAKTIIIEGFFEEVMEALSDDYREKLVSKIAKRI